MTNDELAKHQLDRASAALFEAGKISGVAFLLCCVLLTTSSLLVFVGFESAVVTVPIIGLSLSRWHAAEVLIAISCVAYFQTICLHLYQRLLYEKVEMLVPATDGKIFQWYYYHPSMFFFLEQICEEAPGIARLIAFTVMVGFAPGGFLYPLFLMFIIGKIVRFSGEWWGTAILGTFFQLSGVIFGILMSNRQSRRGMIERLEKY